MKIRDLGFITRSDIKRLGERANMTVEDYVNWCERQRSTGVRLNKFFDNICKKIIDRRCDEDLSVAVEKEDLDLFFPLAIDKDAGLIKNLCNAFAEIGSELTRRGDIAKYQHPLTYASFPKETFTLKRVADTLLSIYGENKTVVETAEELTLTPERIRSMHVKTISALLAGDTICENIQLHPEIVEWANNISDEYMFKQKSDLLKAIGECEVERLDILGFDTIEVGNTDINFIVPKGFKRLYSTIAASLLSVLRDNIVPFDKVAITERLEKHYKMASVESYNPMFVDNFLNCVELIDTGESGLQLRVEWLSTDEQRMARLIYDHKMPISSRDAQVKFQELYGHKISGGFTVLKKFGLKNIYGNMWAFAGKELEPIQSFVSQFAEEHKTFFFSEIEAALDEAGYTIPSSIRSYITNVCQVDNEDKQHFCHKNFVDEFPEVNWRSRSREGLTNWILNCVKDYLSDKEITDQDKLYSFIESKAKDAEYSERIRYRAQFTISEYSGVGKPFLIKDDQLMKNVSIFDSTDFDTIGLKGGKYPFFVQIRSIILNALKKTENGRIALVDAVKLVNGSIDAPQSRNTVVAALTNKHLPDIHIELLNIDGRVYVIRTGADSVAPVYEIKAAADKDIPVAVEEAKEIAEIRPDLTYRLTLNWSELEMAMKRELSFYKNWMGYEHIDFEDAITKFARFLRDAESSNLNRKLPQYLYEYWFARTDNYDRETYVSQLAIFFEGLLSEIMHKNTGARLRKEGLGAWIREFPGIASAVSLPSHMTKGFDRIYKDLYYKRNKYAHGEAIEMSSSETAKTISDYAALYVFTIAKYA